MSTIPDGSEATPAIPVCGLRGVRADVRCNGPLIWRVVYFRGVGSHRVESGRVDGVCFTHADYEERWTKAAAMMRYARMELDLRPETALPVARELRRMEEPADVRTHVPYVGEQGPEPWSRADADRMRGTSPEVAAAADIPGVKSRDPWDVDMNRMRRKVATGELVEAIRNGDLPAPPFGITIGLAGSVRAAAQEQAERMRAAAAGDDDGTEEPDRDGTAYPRKEYEPLGPIGIGFTRTPAEAAEFVAEQLHGGEGK